MPPADPTNELSERRELIERIDAALSTPAQWHPLDRLLRDCKAALQHTPALADAAQPLAPHPASWWRNPSSCATSEGWVAAAVCELAVWQSQRTLHTPAWYEGATAIILKHSPFANSEQHALADAAPVTRADWAEKAVAEYLPLPKRIGSSAPEDESHDIVCEMVREERDALLAIITKHAPASVTGDVRTAGEVELRESLRKMILWAECAAMRIHDGEPINWRDVDAARHTLARE